MNIEEELLSVLETNNKAGDLSQRNIDLVMYFYGFGEDERPTLEFTAELFGIGTRERVRQVINKTFRDHIGPNDLPNLKKCSEILRSKSSWLRSEYLEALVHERLATASHNVAGIMDLIGDIALCSDYKIYDPTFSLSTRRTLTQYDDYFVLRADTLRPLRRAFKKARSLPGMLGLANTRYLVDSPKGAPLDIIISAIRLNFNSWMTRDGQHYWYCFEDRENVLVNFAAKVFNLAAEIDIRRLADCFSNGLSARTNKFDYPGEAIIEKFIRTSNYFECEGQLARFVGDLEVFTDIQSSIVSHLRKMPTASFTDIQSHLIKEGYGKPNINKALTSSCLVHVDRSGGRRNYRYSLVSSVASDVAASSPAVPIGRLGEFQNRLRNVGSHGSDRTVEITTRREHHILQEWLFSGKEVEDCAICGQTFSVKALVTAHKKKRAECNDRERLDPHIVMPLCEFGCDFLYDRGYIYIENGIVRENSSVQCGPHEKEYIRKILGHSLSPRWLKGDPSYFRKPIH